MRAAISTEHDCITLDRLEQQAEKRYTPAYKAECVFLRRYQSTSIDSSASFLNLVVDRGSRS